MSTTLIFPAGMPESLERLSQLVAQGEAVIGASSLANDPAQPLYPSWASLPFVTDAAFEPALLALLQHHAVTSIFTRHPIIARYLSSMIATHGLAISLDAATFAATTIAEQHSIFSRVDALLHQPLSLDIPHARPPLGRLQMASMLTHTLRVEGQSSDEKIFAFMEIFRSCPTGDIVEIGSFWGRSACLLAQLARHYWIGALLCIDPWENRAAHQDGVPSHVNDEACAIDFASAFDGFCINLIPYHPGYINYIRSDSHMAASCYRPGLVVTSEAFGSTTYTGSISCLHIDGNHGFAHVAKDIDHWVPHMAPGGWVVIDDYQWAFGDDPKRAADDWMRTHHGRFTRAFVTGSSLFINIGNRIVL